MAKEKTNDKHFEFPLEKNGESKLKTTLKILNISFIVLLLVTIAVLSVLLYNAYSGKLISPQQTDGITPVSVADPQYEIIKRYAREPFTLTAHSPVFNDDIYKKVLFQDGGMGEVWIPLLTDVPLNQLKNENYHNAENGFKYYLHNGSINSLVGIDVSVHNGDIDWQKVKAAGVDFAFIRTGVRTYGSGVSKLDDNYQKNIQGAVDAGIKVGVYFFSQAVSVEEAVEESNLILDAIEPYEISFPVVYDWEIIAGDDARTDDVKVADFTDCAIAFCENIKNNGYVPMIYASRKLLYLKYDLSRLTDYDFWVADYNDETSYYYDYKIWQYSNTGKVDGISGDVDLNISFVDYSGEFTEPIPVSSVFQYDTSGNVIDATTTSTSTSSTISNEELVINN
ncbi:MAG: glycoside hydrolase family 25 protein [Oscillospiraceae bacterium]|nr:glycoside hydrolase family 25 protein [Oscillospiraceae bacterium]